MDKWIKRNFVFIVGIGVVHILYDVVMDYRYWVSLLVIALASALKDEWNK